MQLTGLKKNLSSYSLKVSLAPLLLLALLILFSTSAFAEQRKEGRKQNDLFSVPLALRERVNFWIDIFAKYGQHQAVIHHRDYPGVVFGVLDFSDKANELSALTLSKYKEKVKSDQVKQIRSALSSLAQGKPPSDPIEKIVAERMERVPGRAPKKYRDAISNDLIRTQTGIKERFGQAIERSGRYLTIMQDIFKQYNLPIELTRLPFVESSFDYKAYSSVGAAGIWQFMPRTGKLYKLQITKAVDQRRDPILATHAAAQYLKAAYATLGNWPLALTSYNHGVYGVLKAVRKIGTVDIAEIVEHPTQRVFGFASNNFYPEFLAALEVYDNYKLYFPNLQIEPSIQFEEVQLKNPISVLTLERRLGVHRDELMQYNYSLLKSVWNNQLAIPKGFRLKVPLGYGEKAQTLGNTIDTSLNAEVITPPASVIHAGVTYKVRKGDTLGSVAKHFKTSVAEIKALNSIKGNVIRVGQILRVKAHLDDRSDSQTKKGSNTRSQASALKKAADLDSPTSKSYRVRKGDSLWSISKAFGVSVQELKVTNGIKSGKIKEGDVLKIPK